MEPKPEPPELAEADQAPASGDAPATPSVPEITPAGLPSANSFAAPEEQPAEQPPQEQTEKQQNLEAAAQDLNKTPAPTKKNHSHVGVIIFATVFVVTALSLLAVYAYLQSK